MWVRRREYLAADDGVLQLVAVDREPGAAPAGAARADRTIVGGQVVGWAAGGSSRDEVEAGVGEIFACYVAPARHRSGIGGLLLDALLDRLTDAPRVDLWVLRDHVAARSFYATRGFAPDGTERFLDLGGPVVEIRLSRG